MTGKAHSPAPLVQWAAKSPVAFVLVPTLTLLGLMVLYRYYYPIHHDLAGSVLSGQLAVQLGDQFREYSIYFPPAERVWYSLAARISEWTDLRLDLTIVVMSFLVLLFGCGLAYRIRRITVGATPLFFVTSFTVFVVAPILFKNVFGLREHVVAAGLWPYLVLRISDPEGSRVDSVTRAVLGLWMGCTLLLKYLYSVVVLLVELADSMLQRRVGLLFRIENLAAGAIVAAYLFAWLVLDASQREAIGSVVSAIDANLVDRRTNLLQLASQLPLLLFFLLASRSFQLSRRNTAIGVALVVGAIIVAWSQSRWYTHHMFPITLAYLVWWWTVAREFKWWGHAAVTLLIVMPIANEYRSIAPYRLSVQELSDAMEGAGQSVNDKRVGFLAMHPSPYNQFLASHGAHRWNTSVNNSYVAAELKPFDTPENANIPPPPVTLEDPGRQTLHDDMLRLWEDMPPDALILDRGMNWPLKHIEVKWEHVFSNNHRFQAILNQYEPVLDYEGARVAFTYFERIEVDR